MKYARPGARSRFPSASRQATRPPHPDLGRGAGPVNRCTHRGRQAAAGCTLRMRSVPRPPVGNLVSALPSTPSNRLVGLNASADASPVRVILPTPRRRGADVAARRGPGGSSGSAELVVSPERREWALMTQGHCPAQCCSASQPWPKSREISSPSQRQMRIFTPKAPMNKYTDRSLARWTILRDQPYETPVDNRALTRLIEIWRRLPLPGCGLIGAADLVFGSGLEYRRLFPADLRVVIRQRVPRRF